MFDWRWVWMAWAGAAAAFGQEPAPKQPPQPPARKIDRPPTPADPAATRAAFAREFLDPFECDRQFGAEVAKLIAEKKTVPAQQLRDQAFAARRWSGAPLPAMGPRLDSETIYRKAKPSAVILAGVHQCGVCPDWHPKSASGFVVAKGVVATNAHVLDALRTEATLVVVTAEGKVHAITAGLAADRHNDVALVRVEGLDAPALPLADNPPVGATVYCVSNPALNSRQTGNAYFAFTQGMVSGKYHIPSGGRRFDAMAVTLDYCKGSSGAPILDARGAAVGMVCTADPVMYNERSQSNPQMVWRCVRPASVIRDLFAPPGPSAP